MSFTAPRDNAADHSFRDPLHDHPKAGVDIVFVHGIGGHPVETWESKNNVYWPRDLLPQTIAHARVLSWPHDAKIGNFFSVKSVDRTIDDISRGLLQDLFAYRRDTETADRPIIFVAHSLGGIIAVNALALAQTEGDMKPLADRVHALALLGVPLRGSKWSNIASSIGKAFGFELKIAADDLKKGSRILEGILQRSLKVLRQRVNKGEGGIYGACFFEEEGMTKLKNTKVVERSDATIDIFDDFALPGDHRSMCCFNAATDKGYEILTDQLKTWIEKIGVGKTGQPSVYIGGSTIGDCHGGLTMASFYVQGSSPAVSSPTFNYNPPQN